MDHTEALKFLTNIKEVMNRIKLPFFLTYGTALGFFRDGGFIDGDTDIDIGCRWHEFHDKAGKLLLHLVSDYHYHVNTLYDPFTRCCGLQIYTTGNPDTWIKVDLVAYIRWADQVWGDDCWLDVGQDYCGVFPHPMMAELDCVHALGQHWHIPSSPQGYFRMCYGKNWVRKRSDHALGSRDYSSARVDEFLQTRGVPANLLETAEIFLGARP